MSTKDEQARARLVEIALATVDEYGEAPAHYRCQVRERAGFRDPSNGSGCAAGLTAAMDDAGLVVPAPGTPARRGALALVDWTFDGHSEWGARRFTSTATAVSAIGVAKPGDVVAWQPYRVAVIVDTDSESITVVEWDFGLGPGSAHKRKLLREPLCSLCRGQTSNPRYMSITAATTKSVPYLGEKCPRCKGSGRDPASVLWAYADGLYGIARPIAVDVDSAASPVAE